MKVPLYLLTAALKLWEFTKHQQYLNIILLIQPSISFLGSQELYLQNLKSVFLKNKKKTLLISFGINFKYKHF